jgi:hypothetical protein
MEQERRHEAEAGESQRRPVGDEADRQQDASAQLDDDGQGREDGRHRQALRGDVADGALEAGDLLEAVLDEEDRQQDAADERERVLQCEGMAILSVEARKPFQARSKTSTSACSPPPILSDDSFSRPTASPEPRAWPLTTTLPRTTCTQARRFGSSASSADSSPSNSPADIDASACSVSEPSRPSGEAPGAACRACSPPRSASARIPPECR